MSRSVLPNTLARRLFLDRHTLLESPAGPAKGAALEALIDRLGFVQVDSVNTLARAHDLILWSRRPSYRPASLRWLNDRARATFEHWTHDAAIVPMTFYPHWRLRFARDRARLHGRWKNWHGDRFHGELDRVSRPCLGQRPCLQRGFPGRAGGEIHRLVGLAPLQDRARIPVAVGRSGSDAARGVFASSTTWPSGSCLWRF